MSATGKKAENKTWKLLAPIVVLSCICLVITGALAYANQITAPVIKAAEQAKAEAAMKVVLPEGSDFQDLTGVTLSENVASAKKAGNDAGYVFTVISKGFGGDISTMIGMDPDGKITGTQVITNAETQGIGSKVVENNSAFQQQLVGMSDTSGIQAVSGATISSKALTAAMQTAFDAYTVISGGTVEKKVATRPETLTDEVLQQYYPGVAFTEVPGGMTSDAGAVVFGIADGMESEIKVAVLFNADGKVLGVTVDAMNETEDYGTQCGEKAFTDLFAGITNADEVDGISGATVTSDAVKTAVNDAIANYETVKGAA